MIPDPFVFGTVTGEYRMHAQAIFLDAELDVDDNCGAPTTTDTAMVAATIGQQITFGAQLTLQASSLGSLKTVGVNANNSVNLFIDPVGYFTYTSLSGQAYFTPDPAEQGGHEVTGVLDAAGFEALISPGSIVSVFGEFDEETDLADSIPLPLDLGGFSVTFDGKPGALFGVFAGETFDQANVQVPWDVDVSDGQVEVKVHWKDDTSEVWSEPFTLDGEQASPGIYLFPPGTSGLSQR